MKAFFLMITLCAALSGTAIAQDVTTIKLDQLNELIDETPDKLRVINFWASWCGPCIKEMPHFDKLHTSKQAEVYFISLDFPRQLPKVKNLVSKKDLKAPTYLLDEKDADQYIQSIDEKWSGAIPATLFITPSGERYFYESAFTEDELMETVKKLSTK